LVFFFFFFGGGGDFGLNKKRKFSQMEANSVIETENEQILPSYE
jgi:flagellar motor switch protein FliM